MDDKFNCSCVRKGQTNIQEMTAVVELSLLHNNSCAKLALLATARAAGSVAAQVKGILMEELKAEAMRQFDLGIIDAQKLIAEMDGQRVDN